MSDNHHTVTKAVASRKCEACGRPHLARGLCGYHYKLWRYRNVPGALEARNKQAREAAMRRRRAAGLPRREPRRPAEPRAPRLPITSRKCTQPGCERKHKAKGLCFRHYFELRNKGRGRLAKNHLALNAAYWRRQSAAITDRYIRRVRRTPVLPQMLAAERALISLRRYIKEQRNES